MQGQFSRSRRRKNSWKLPTAAKVNTPDELFDTISYGVWHRNAEWILSNTVEPTADPCEWKAVGEGLDYNPHRVSDGKITARAEDDRYLKELKIYLPTGEDSYALSEILTPAYDPDVHEASLSAAWPEGAEYVYVRAEDYAGNVTVYRQYGN
jgi:hypothetical protein